MSDNPVEGNEKPKRGLPDETMRGPDNRNLRLIGAVVLIALGVIFLLQQFGLSIPLLDHWWALFILVPGIGLLWEAYQKYTYAGRWTNEVRGQLTGGVLIVFVGTILLFDLDWGKFWPFFLIIPGVLLLLNPRHER